MKITQEFVFLVFLITAQVALISARLQGHIDWRWGWVFCPLWVSAIVFSVFKTKHED